MKDRTDTYIWRENPRSEREAHALIIEQGYRHVDTRASFGGCACGAGKPFCDCVADVAIPDGERPHGWADYALFGVVVVCFLAAFGLGPLLKPYVVQLWRLL